MACRQGNRRGSASSRGKNDEGENSSQCPDCKKAVTNNDQALECDLCCRWLHAKCQEVPTATYTFLSENKDESIKWYCKHCKVTALGIVNEVSKMAASFKDMEKRVKKLETQVKSKANEADLAALRTELHGELEEKASAEELHELQQTRPSKETIKQMIKEEIQAVGTTTVRPAEGNTEEEDGDRRGEIANEVMDIESRKNNIIIYRVAEDPQSSYLTQDTQRNTKDIETVKEIMKVVTGTEGAENISKCTRLGKPAPEKKRPLLVSFKSGGEKENFMENLRKLKESKFNNISIAHDLTSFQRQQLKKLREEARHKQNTESGDWVYRVVGHPSRWTVKKLKKRTQTHLDQTESNTTNAQQELPE